MEVSSCTTHNPSQGGKLRKALTTVPAGSAIVATMKRNRPKRRDDIYGGRQPNRPHFIPQWAEKRGYKDQAALVKALGADKSIVSRWYSGSSPTRNWQLKLAALFGHKGEPEIIFRHPDSDWLARFFKGRSPDEVERAQRLLETAFPSKPAAN